MEDWAMVADDLAIFKASSLRCCEKQIVSASFSMVRRSGPIVRDFSAGGVIYRRRPAGIEIALVGQRAPERWQLPKGTPNRGESPEQVALREAQEETGLLVRLVCPLDEIQYWFAIGSQRHFKTVAFYLMEAIGGDTALHDGEYSCLPTRRRSYRLPLV
jgi:8-oxo-dGTP pyrophosphatase MutT (NUDIX family)